MMDAMFNNAAVEPRSRIEPMRTVRLDDTPDGQIQVWLYKPPTPQNLSDLWENLIAYGIELCEGFDGARMSICMGNVVWSAQAEGFVTLSAIRESRYPGEIRVFTWEPPLTEREHDAARQALVDMEGVGYDYLLFGQRTAVAVARFLGYLVKHPILDLITTLLPIDVLGARAVLCYESVARVINAIGREKVNPATYGPKQLLGGPLVCKGVLEKSA